MAARDNSGVRFPPPLLYVAGLLAGWLLERKYPLTSLPRNISLAAGIILCVAGFVVARAGAMAIWKANSSIIPMRPTTAIVTQGVKLKIGVLGAQRTWSFLLYLRP